MSILSNLLFYLVGMWLQKLILISDLQGFLLTSSAAAQQFKQA